MGTGEGARSQRTQSAVRPHRGLASVPLFLIIIFFLCIHRTPLAEALSGGEPAELMMQQSGTKEGYDEHSGGLNYEH